MFRIVLDEDRPLLRLPEVALPAGWDGRPWPAVTQALGTLCFERADSPVLEVPCAVVPVRRTCVLNLWHSENWRSQVRSRSLSTHVSVKAEVAGHLRVRVQGATVAKTCCPVVAR